MSILTRAQLVDKFGKTGKIPSAQDFKDLLDTIRMWSEPVPSYDVDGTLLRAESAALATNPALFPKGTIFFASVAGTYANYPDNTATPITVGVNEFAVLVPKDTYFVKQLIPIDLTGYLTKLNAEQDRINFSKLGYNDPVSLAASLSVLGFDNIATTGSRAVTFANNGNGLRIGYNTVTDGQTTFYKTGLKYADFSLLRFTIIPTTFHSVTPCIGFGYGNFATQAGLGYGAMRTNGQVVRGADYAVTANYMTANTDYDYATGETVIIELDCIATKFRMSVAGGAFSSWITIPVTVADDIMIATRGGVTFDVKLEAYYKSYVLEESKDYTDGSILPFDGRLLNLEEGGIVNKLSATPYTDYVYNATYATIASGTTQTAGDSGLTLNIAPAGSSSLTYINTGVTAAAGKKYRLSFKLNTALGVNPCIGLGWGTVAGTLTGFGYRTTGTILSAAVTGAAGVLANPRSVGTGYDYSAGDTVAIELDLSAMTAKTYKNGVPSPPTVISGAITGNLMIFFRDNANISNVRLIEVTKIENQPLLKTVYVDTAAGSNNNTGTINSKFQTINKALSEVAGYKYAKIIAEGEARETLDFANFRDATIIIESPIGKRLRFMGSTLLSGWAKTAGRTNIYEATLTGAVIATPVYGSKRIFEEGKESMAIGANERYPHQKGLTHRLPYTEIIEQALVTDLAGTLTALDAAPGKYYYDAANNKIYVHTSGSDDPAVNTYKYEVPVRAVNTSPAIITNTTLELKGVEADYSSLYGFTSKNMGLFIRRNCTTIGSANEGWKDDAVYVESYNEEAGGSGNDGANGHLDSVTGFETMNKRTPLGYAFYYMPWWHDNKGDGCSHHERAEMRIIEPLAEYNLRRGIIPSYGANAVVLGGCLRGNGWEGLSLSGPAVDGRPGITARVVNCVSEGNAGGFTCEDNSALILINCKSRNNLTVEYHSNNNGKILAIDCTVANGDPAKYKIATAGGTITVQNDTPLT